MGENSCGEENRVGVAMRWTTDPGAIPGEPYDYLDIPRGEDGEIGEAKAVIIEIDTPGGSRWIDILPIGVLCPIEGGGLGLGMHVENVVAAPGGAGVGIVLDGAEVPVS